ncbi:MAG TPA: hypothetical protein VNT22_02405 [Baekduia sp.]|nr:hypothetical protein [Baekduia sp.]
MRIAIAGATGLVGTRLTAAAKAAGHDVLEISRSKGVDLTTGWGLDLAGVDAVIDVTNSPEQTEAEATAYFATVARLLGRAATAADVPRTVLLSIVGIDQTPEDGYNVAKLAHERVTLESAPGVRILRATQFHEFPGQMLGWTRDGDKAEIPAMPVQPVDLDGVVARLLELATAADAPALVEIAGPRRELLPDLVERLDPTVDVTAGPVTDAVRDGALLPGPEAEIVGREFSGWLADRAGS